jgi:manganese transport protein
MGEFINRPITHSLGWLTVSIVIGLNLFLLWQTFAG